MTSSTARKRSTPKRAETTTEPKASTKSKVKEPDYGKPVHKVEESLLTSTSGFDNYRGLINLCLILLVLSNFRVALDNLLKYGLLIDPFQVITIFLEDPYHWPSALLVIWAANIAVSWYTVVWLKLISFVSVNLWYRLGLMKHEKEGHVANGKPETLPLVKYPENLTQKGVKSRFKLACKFKHHGRLSLINSLPVPQTSPVIMDCSHSKELYETNPGRNVTCEPSTYALCFKGEGLMVKFNVSQEMDVGRGLERLMKLAVPNHLLWLLFFYAFFHSGLNILAELLRFGDRTFYRDWWNSPNVAYFWQNWNIPVHRWARRHLYIPMLKSGYSSLQAQVAVFLLSAFFHEAKRNVRKGKVTVVVQNKDESRFDKTEIDRNVHG
ncbi:Diacylglycerol O-acyltransferase 1 [Stylophora pistillata]|uniref:diacylglycerol O-acyltransferase n=1 Tax=Stylophora pistillata TaxID=50429 RepID=A0A2B4RY01_STYPI|nr:Diacylglycerol O-acyltransferase 1 [Stylophora pistillata]